MVEVQWFWYMGVLMVEVQWFWCMGVHMKVVRWFCDIIVGGCIYVMNEIWWNN
jgi:hypothetical protein